MKRIAFIPARKGSKSIPWKNIKLLCGKPLIYWSLKALVDSDEIDEVYVATDSQEIEFAVNSFCFSKVFIYHRKSENAQDYSSTESVMLEFIESASFADSDIFVLVQATMPLLKSDDITNAFNLLRDKKAESLVTCVRLKRFLWDSEGNPLNYDYKRRPRRQDFDGLLMENGSFYISEIGKIRDHQNRLSGKIAVFEMPHYTAIEIDEEDDWDLVEKLMQKYVLHETKGPKIKAVFTDVDGTLTDSGMYYGESGDELKKFNTRDGKAFELLRNDGIITGIITAENTNIVSRRAQKLKVDYLFQGVSDKLTLMREFCQKNSISMDEIAYAGDDLNDIELLSAVGIAACPSDAILKVKQIPGIKILGTKGGDGAVREFVDRYIIG